MQINSHATDSAVGTRVARLTPGTGAARRVGLPKKVLVTADCERPKILDFFERVKIANLVPLFFS
jgi:hypothetical protein